jgi:uncharacterized SAM-binding protein YcdF (DUF218 family)
VAAPNPRGGLLVTGATTGALLGFLVRDLDLLALVSYWGDRAPVVLVGALVGALLWPTRLRAVLLGTTAALLALWLVVAFTPAVRWLGAGLTRRDPPGAADGVFVLGSALQADGEPTAPALARLVHGLELIGEGRATRLILTELPEPSARYAAVAQPLLQHLRLETELLTVGPVNNTRDEVVLVARLCRQRGFQRLLVVTSPWHSRRACAALEHEGVVAVGSPAVETQFDAEALDRMDSRMLAFGRALHERVGLWYYTRRGWIR